MRIIELHEDNIMKEISNNIRFQRELLNYFIPQKTCAFVGWNMSVADENALKEYNVTKLELNNEGGVIVSEPGSLSIGYFSKNINNRFNIEFAKILIEYLIKRGLNITLEDNDILIDGMYKCASFSSRRFNKIIFSAFHISYDVNLELINKICTKPMKKIPRGLKEYGITAEDIQSFFLENYENILNIS